jgi:hypothetical protein
MTDNKPPTLPDPEQQATQAQQQQNADDVQIHGQFAATDMAQRVTSILSDVFGSGTGVSLFGKTSFENAPLNAMLDLLDSANPEDLEQAGIALTDATTALNKAATDLAHFVKDTDWEGQAANEFRRYGAELVTYTYGLGTFANTVGEQMKVASTGLASVRNSKPPRDGRPVQKKPDDFAMPERTQDNQDYQKALQVEKDRQEAINQMNRLASFYAVSESTLAAQEPPTPPKPLAVGVPMPSGGIYDESPSQGATGSADLRQATATPTSVSRANTSEVESASRPDVSGKPVEVPDKPVAPVGSNPSVVIDTVATPPAPTAPVGTPPTAPAPNPTGPTNTAPPLIGPIGTPPRATTPPKTIGTQGVPRPSGQGPTTVGRPTGNGPSTARPTGPVGRPGMPGPTSSGPAAGRSANPVGRPGMMGTGPAPAGRNGLVGGTNQTPMGGRPGMPAQGPAGRQGPSAAPRGGHSNGIVGGTPQRPTGGNTGARLPKGTVIGGEVPAAGRPSTARPSQSGVIGAHQGAGASRPTGRGTPSVNGVVGTPRSATGPAGASVAGGRGGQRPSRDEEQERNGSTRPDYLTEDEETWTARRRGAVPPVID